MNNAQVPPLGPLALIPEELFDTGWKTGPLATFRFMRACYQHLKDGGSIVNMGSGSAIRPDLTAFGGYGACKEAIRTMSRAAACEWGVDGIRVNVVLPLAMSPAMGGFLEEHPEARDGVLGSIPLGFIGDCRARHRPRRRLAVHRRRVVRDRHEPLRRRRTGLRALAVELPATIARSRCEGKPDEGSDVLRTG